MPKTKPDTTAENTKREAFVRLGAARVQKVLDAMDVLKNCANTSQYEYTEADVNKLEATLNKSVVNLIRVFRGQDPTDTFTF